MYDVSILEQTCQPRVVQITYAYNMCMLQVHVVVAGGVVDLELVGAAPAAARRPVAAVAATRPKKEDQCHPPGLVWGGAHRRERAPHWSRSVAEHRGGRWSQGRIPTRPILDAQHTTISGGPRPTRTGRQPTRQDVGHYKKHDTRTAPPPKPMVSKGL